MIVSRAAALALAAALVSVVAGTGASQAPSPPASATPASRSPAAGVVTRRALLIGIDNYLSDQMRTLRGCVNDVARMKSVLMGRFEVEETNILTLKNEEATREAILGAIQTHLIDKARPGAGDVVILHFSGHGSQAEDDSSDEVDGYDETIVPHDSRVGTVRDITDDKLNELLGRLSTKTPNVTVIFDSCHSGSGVRSVQSGTARQAPPDLRPPPRRPADRGLVEGPDDMRPLGANYVLLSGSLPNELSNEDVFGDRSHGALTYALAQAIESAPPRATYRDLMDRVQAEVTSRFPSQHPQLEGAGIDAVVFGTDRLTSRFFVPVEPAGGSDVTIAAGQVQGLTPETLLRVYAPDTKTFADAPVAARVKVTSVNVFDSRGTIQDGGPVPAHSRAVLEAVKPMGFRAGLLVEGADASPLLRAVSEGLAEYDFVKPVTTLPEAHLRLRVAGGKALLMNHEGDVVGTVDTGAADGTTDLIERVLHWARWYGALGIENANEKMDVDLRIERAGPNGKLSPAPEELSPGTKVTITAENRSSQPLYMILLDITSDGAVVPLRPRRGIPPEQVAPGRSISINPTASLKPGRDRVLDVVKVIATTKPVPSETFELAAAKRGILMERGNEDALNAYLRRSMQGRARDFDLEPVVVDDWVTRTRSVRVTRPEARAESFAAHFATPAAAGGAAGALRGAGGRAVCGGPDDETCYKVAPSGIDPTIVEVRRPTRRDAAAPPTSVGQAFEEAYQLRRETGAVRVEPLFEIDVPHPNRPPEARGSLFDSKPHDARAEADPKWSLKHVRAVEAWAALQAAPLRRPAGAEASGVVIAHPDTGYRPHPEIWHADPAQRPVWAEVGYDYVKDDHDPVDDLSDDQLLDNPGHGTGSGSAIVSPDGCQTAGEIKCPTGVGRGARLVPLRVHRSVVHFDTRQLSQAITDAAGNDRTHVGTPTNLMSISMGGVPSWTLWRAVTNAEKRGYLILAAAGNYVHTVVWPARFRSTIAVAATNVGCRPWAYTSAGSAVDVSAPGESVWRASMDKDDRTKYVTGMGSGTTYATATVAGVAALWMSKYAGSSAFKELHDQGRVTETFRKLVRESSWQPGASPARTPAGVVCDAGAAWNSRLMGAGIVDAAALLDRELPVSASRSPAPPERIEDLPLFGSLYPVDTPRAVVWADYRRLFALGPTDDSLAVYEAEVMHHYALSPDVAGAIDALVTGANRSADASLRASQALQARDLSDSLRAAVQR